MEASSSATSAKPRKSGKHRRTPEEFAALKAQALEAVKEGKSSKAIAKRLKVGESTVTSWRSASSLSGNQKNKTITDQQAARVLKLVADHGDWSHERIGKKAGISGASVARIANGEGRFGKIKAAKSKNKARGSTHLAHPKCPHCQYALFKWMPGKPNVGASTKYPYAWCRNKKCKKHGVNQQSGRPIEKRRNPIRKEEKSAKRRTSYDPDTLSRLLADYALGGSPDDIAKEYALPNGEAVLRMAKEHGVKLGDFSGVPIQSRGSNDESKLLLGPGVTVRSDSTLLMQIATRLAQSPGMRKAVREFLDDYAS